MFYFRLKVRDLLHAVGKKCGIDPSGIFTHTQVYFLCNFTFPEIDKLDLENVIERAVAINVFS